MYLVPLHVNGPNQLHFDIGEVRDDFDVLKEK